MKFPLCCNSSFEITPIIAAIQYSRTRSDHLHAPLALFYVLILKNKCVCPPPMQLLAIHLALPSVIQGLILV
jgi:hypothetical protein